MEPTSRKSQDIVDTTDSLEAIGVCKSMKNFLFLVMLIGLLLPQVIFWLHRVNLIEQKACKACSDQKTSCQMKCPAGPQAACPKSDSEKTSSVVQSDTQPPAEATGLLPLAATVNVAEEVEKVTESVEQSQPQTEAVAEEKIILETEEDQASPEQIADESQADSDMDVAALFKISCNFARGLVAICNFLVLIGAILYSLTLLMCLKISLTGRLGGINHIARAFFISLLLMVILVPWQRILPGVLVGTVWLPKELLCGGWCKAQGSTFWKILFYLRFCGMWFVALWFLLWAQTRSAKWARATLRRLGVVK
ncbi:MAG: hypothetical protein ISS71_05375 [Phycisphaerae bacterium]|nr:hypothetical protein [Phycisphaerae bacterium]